jgi:hypothetical protein
MPITLDQARTLVFDHLQTLADRHQPVNVGIVAVDRAIRPTAQQRGIEVEWNNAEGALAGMDSVTVRAALSELEKAGLIVWGLSAIQAAPPHFQLTEFGVQCLREGRINPYDPEGYLSALVARVPALDPTARAYLEEALECLRRSCYRACAVMLGGASERVMMMLIDSFHRALQDQRRRARFEKNALKPISIRRRFDYFRTELGTIRAALPNVLAEDLDLRLDGAFALIRAARNDGGHPSINAAVTRDTAHGNLLLFPSYWEKVDALIGHLRNNPIP